MSRRKQARPIRVLESEEGSSAGNLPVMDLANGDGSSEAASGSGGTLSESEDEDAANYSMLEMPENHGEFLRNCTMSTMAMIATLKSSGQFLADFDKQMNKCFTDNPSKRDERENSASNPFNIQELYLQLEKHSKEAMLHLNVVEQLKQQLQFEKSSSRPSSPVQQCELETVASNPNHSSNNDTNIENVGSRSSSNNNDNQSAIHQLKYQQLVHRMSLMHQLQAEMGARLSLPNYLTRSSSPVQQCETENVSINDNNNNNSNNVPMGLPLVVTRPSSPTSIAKPSRTPTPVKQEPRAESPIPRFQPSSSAHPTPIKRSSSPPNVMTSQPPIKKSSSPPNVMVSLPPCSVSSAFASSIITNFDPPPSPSEPNSLEMLQKRTQEVLDNASQGLLANNLADDLVYRKNGANGKGDSLSPYDSKSGVRNADYYTKHRCKYCGKNFGSDSALQIHIRSHTGERPFKCNICGSRFTTKGNLKVHFQRHTSKFPNIKMNPNPVPEHLDKYHPPLLTQMNNQQSMPPGNLTPYPSISLVDRSSSSYGDCGIDLKMRFQRHLPNIPALNLSQNPISDNFYSPLLAQVNNHHSTIPPGIPPPVFHFSASIDRSSSPYAECSNNSKSSNDVEGVQKNLVDGMDSDGSFQEKPENLSNKSNDEKFNHNEDRWNSPSPQDDEQDSMDVAEALTARSEGSLRSNEDCQSADGDRDTNSAPATAFSEGSAQDYNEDMESADGEQDNTSTATVIAPGEDGQQEQPENLSNKTRGNTTCNICYKTFACNSALEIHYRSHTKERPFKCEVCDRGFSTKGNMKQHLLTHKSRLPGDCLHSQFFDKSALGSVSMPSSVVDETSNTSTESKETIPNSAASLRACVPALDNLTASLHKAITPSLNVLAPPMSESVAMAIQKRSPDSETPSLPIVKRQCLPKHLCNVCNKNFSSSSALQIHMRTHTGDKPFSCEVCLKAFTTKGNLKVHMGTHMWSNHTSRRGRRMSLEVPATYKGKDSPSEMFNRRPEFSYYPYLTAPFLNGMQKTLTNGFYPFTFNSSLSELKRSSSPMSPSLTIGRHLNLDPHSSPSPWDLPFKRKTADESVEAKTPSPPHPSHKEGLAA